MRKTPPAISRLLAYFHSVQGVCWLTEVFYTGEECENDERVREGEKESADEKTVKRKKSVKCTESRQIEREACIDFCRGPQYADNVQGGECGS